MFNGASTFDQDLSTWVFSGKNIDDAFEETQTYPEYYPVGCDDSLLRVPGLMIILLRFLLGKHDEVLGRDTNCTRTKR